MLGRLDVRSVDERIHAQVVRGDAEHDRPGPVGDEWRRGAADDVAALGARCDRHHTHEHRAVVIVEPPARVDDPLAHASRRGQDARDGTCPRPRDRIAGVEHAEVERVVIETAGADQRLPCLRSARR